MPLRPSAAMLDPEVGQQHASQPHVRPQSADGPAGGPGPGFLARWIRKVSLNAFIGSTQLPQLHFPFKVATVALFRLGGFVR
jgi:hypothetical protein